MTNDSLRLAQIALRRLNIWTNPREGGSTKEFLDGVILSLEAARLGYRLEPDRLRPVQTERFQAYMETLRAARGSNVKYVPLFTNFPAHVPDDCLYLFRRILGQFGVNTFDFSKYGANPISQMQSEELWEVAVEAQAKHLEDSRTEWIDLKVMDEADAIHKLNHWCMNLLYGSTPVAEYLWDDLLFATFQLDFALDWNRIVIKESLIRIAADRWQLFGVLHALRTPTDLLRLFAFLQKQDVSLAAPVKLKGLKLSKPQRKSIMSFLAGYIQTQSLTALEQELQQYRGLWLSLMRYIHPGDFRNVFPEVVQAFDALYKGQIKTFEALLAASTFKQKLNLLSDRPGLFLRYLTRLAKEGGISQVARYMVENRYNFKEVPMPLLLTIQAALSHEEERLVITKKGTPCMIPPRSLKRLVPLLEVVEQLIFLRLREGGFGYQGSVYLDPALAKLSLPFQARKQSEGTLTLGRGSRLAIPPDVNVLRLFVYWKEQTSRVDIDLSMVVLDENFAYVEQISFDRYNSEPYLVHSGDIQSGSVGATEFIDVRLSKARKNGYLMPAILSYSSISFELLQTCYAGWMHRTDLTPDQQKLRQQAQLFDPKTVANKVTVAQPGVLYFPFLVDLAAHEIVFIDLYRRGKRTVQQNPNILQLARLMAYYGDSHPTYASLAHLWVEANDGIFVSQADGADKVFATADDFAALLES